MTQEYMTYAQEIRNQINSQSPFALMSYGAMNFIASPETDRYKAALSFRVNGFKHKGYIRIELAWNDTYTVTAFKLRKGEVKECGSYDHVYFDQLVDVLDGLVEGREYAQ